MKIVLYAVVCHKAEVSHSVPGASRICVVQLQPAPIHSCSDVSSDPEDPEDLDRVCSIRDGAKLCRAVPLQELSWRLFINTFIPSHTTLQ